MWDVAKDKEVDGLAAPSFSSTRALQLPKQRDGGSCVSTCSHQKPCGAQWSLASRPKSPL